VRVAAGQGRYKRVLLTYETPKAQHLVDERLSLLSGEHSLSPRHSVSNLRVESLEVGIGERKLRGGHGRLGYFSGSAAG
jgi:hypothetical protein